MERERTGTVWLGRRPVGCALAILLVASAAFGYLVFLGPGRGATYTDPSAGFSLHVPPAWSSLGVAVLIVLTFIPFNVLHPIRVVRLRRLTLSLIGAWTVLVMIALTNDFQVSTPVTAALCAIAVYIVGCDAAFRLVRSLNA